MSLIGNGYTLLNTFIFVVVGILIYYLSYLYIVKLRKIKVDLNFIVSVIIFTCIGVILRLFTQSYSNGFGLIASSTSFLSLGFWLSYPFLFVVLGLLFLVCFELSRWISKLIKINLNKILQLIGLAILLPLLVYGLLHIVYWNYFLMIILISLVLVYIIYLLCKLNSSKLLNSKINKIFLLGEVLDGVATVFAVSVFKGTLSEEHILSSIVLSVNPYMFILIKVIVSLIMLYLLDRWIEDENQNNYVKLFVIILSLSTGLRDLFVVGLLI